MDGIYSAGVSSGGRLVLHLPGTMLAFSEWCHGAEFAGFKQ